MTAALRMLAYVTPIDALDDAYTETTVLETLDKFCQSMVDVFGIEYLRSPNEDDVARIREMHESRGWPGMLGSLDCMHWEWKKCPKAYQGAYNGMPGSNNDLNVIERSHLFNDLALGRVTSISFTLRQNTYEHGYYLSDGIYPKWSTIVKTCPNPIREKKVKFAAMQEGQRKDLERDYGVLQSRFSMISNPCRLWSQEKISRIIFACVTIHNMINEDERYMYEQQCHYEYDGVGQMPEVFQDDAFITEEAFNVHVE